MANLTLKQVRDISRAFVSELDNQKITDEEIKLWINLAQRKAQRDTWEFLSKSFIKVVADVSITSGVASVPSDLLNRHDAIIDMLVNSGETSGQTVATKEITLSEYNRLSGNTYLTPSTSAPAYVLAGNASGTRVLNFLPSSLATCKYWYYYLPADLSSDNDTLSIPQEIEELVLLEVQSKMFMKLEKAAGSDKKAVEYQNELTKLKNMILGTLPQAQEQAKRDMQSNDLSK